MPRLIFQPVDVTLQVAENTKILAAARQANIDIRFGCGAGRCGTCAIKVHSGGEAPLPDLSPMSSQERALLDSLDCVTDGRIRLSCQARILTGDCIIDLSFQELL